MAKCFVDDTSLTSIAEAIRTKGGTTDQLVFPAGFISAIEAIEAGGGGRAFASGSFTLSADTTGYTITHNLGEVPYFCLVFCKNVGAFMDSPPYAAFAAFGFSESIGPYNNFNISGTRLGTFSDLITGTNFRRPLYGATSTTVFIRAASFTLVGGKEYHWIAIGA